jgi:hypothetical protein
VRIEVRNIYENYQEYVQNDIMKDIKKRKKERINPTNRFLLQKETKRGIS